MIMFEVTDKTGKYPVSAFSDNEQACYEDVRDIVGDELAQNGIPLAIEISSWASVATLGEVYETKKVKVEVVEVD